MNELWSIMVALPHEAKALREILDVQAVTRCGYAVVHEGLFGNRPTLLVQTGMGPRHAYQSTQYLLRNFPVTHLISTGYCGALVEGLKNADAVVADGVLRAPGSYPVLSVDETWAAQACQSLQSLPFQCLSGKFLTVDAPILKTQAKHEAYLHHHALAVDMETHAILQAVRDEEKKIASLALRFVVDELGEELVDVSNFVDDAGVKPLSLVKEMFRRPKILTQLPNLDHLASCARKNMVLALRKIMGLI